MRIPSGVTDQYIYFVAVDSTDYVTRETGLSSFTVRSSRNGGASAAYTTPTINETDVTNMPGVYELLLDEDMTIDTGDQSQEVCLHITHAGMAPVTRVFELYRTSVTQGETLTVASGIGQASVQSIAAGAITAASIATGAIDADAIADNAIDAGAIATGAITAAKFAAGAIDAAAIATGAIDADALAADAGTEIGTAVWAAAARTLTALDEDSTTLDLDATIRGAVGMAAADLDTQLAAIEAQTDDIGVAGAGLTAIPWNAAWNAEVQSEVADALGVYDPPTKAELDAAVAPLATQVSVDDLPTNAELATALDPLPTANENADALLDRAAGVETGLTVRQAFRLFAAALLGKASGMATTTAVFRDTGDSKDRITATVDADGNRSAVTLDAT